MRRRGKSRGETLSCPSPKYQLVPFTVLSLTVTAKVQLIGFHFVDGARLPLEEISYWPFISWA